MDGFTIDKLHTPIKSLLGNTSSSIQAPPIMNSIFLAILVIILCIFFLDAFLPVHPGRPLKKLQHAGTNIRSSLHVTVNGSGSTSQGTARSSLTHKDILWKLRPPPDTSAWKRLWLRFAGHVIRLDCYVFRKDPPIALCPKGGQAVLEAYCKDGLSSKFEKVGRFGFTTERGPPSQSFQETVHDVYGISSNVRVGVAAIIYMYVEPKYRNRNIGCLALDVISLIHAMQGCDFTVLVVDDDGSGKLIDWYSRYGYSRAPKLQEILGSPNAVNGITMIAPTNNTVPHDCIIQWW